MNGTGNGSSSTNGNGTSQTPVISHNLPSSYASQAGTGVPLTSGAPGLPGVASQASTREFGPEDFPALGGQNQTSAVGQENHGGINGFQNEGSRNVGGFPSEGSRMAVNVAVGGLRGFGSDADSRVSVL